MRAEATDAERRRFVARAVARLSFVELWERYSYFTLFALLPLFVAAPVRAGGLGWSDGEALRFFGTYLLAVQVAPLLGGWIADRWLGGLTALRLGAASLLAGHAAMALLTLLPRALGLTRLGVPLMQWNAVALVPAASRAPYLASTGLFYLSVALVAFGNGLFKPVLTVVVGLLPHRGEAERNNAFTVFFLFLNIGGLISLIAGGALAQGLGWAWAFGASTLGMAVSLAAMTLLGPTYIQPYVAGGQRAGAGPASLADETAMPASWPAALALMLTLFVTVCVFSYQSYGFVNLFTAKLVDRRAFGLVIPPTWFTALNPVTIMALTPALVWLARRGGTPVASASARLGLSLLVMAGAFALLRAAAVQAGCGHLANPGWIAGGIALIAVGELLFTPAVTSAITRLTPSGHRSLGVGALTAAAGAGAWLSGQVGSMAIEGDRTAVLTILCCVAAATGGLLIVFRRRFATFSL